MRSSEEPQPWQIREDMLHSFALPFDEVQQANGAIDRKKSPCVFFHVENADSIMAACG
jgi:hypothetical protein